MKVYVLVKNWQMDCGDCGLNVVKVFETYQQAYDCLLVKRKQAKIDMEDLETEEDTLVEGDMCWSIWEKDKYCYNHIDLKIEEKEVIMEE